MLYYFLMFKFLLQVQNHLSALTKTVTELEELDKIRNELINWLKQQTIIITECKTKPMKLRNDLNKADLSNVEGILPVIKEKVDELEGFKTPENDEILSQLDSLKELVIMVQK